MHESMWVSVFSWELNFFRYAEDRKINVCLTSGATERLSGEIAYLRDISMTLCLFYPIGQ